MAKYTSFNFLDSFRGWAACVAIALTACVYSFDFLSFLHAKEAVFCFFCMILALVVVISMFQRRNKKRISLAGFSAFLPLWCIIPASMLNLVLGGIHVPSSALLEIARWIILLIAAAFLFDLCISRAWRRRIIHVINISAFLVALLGILQYTGKVSFFFPVFPDYTQRVYSVFGNQDLFGGYLVIALPFLLREAVEKRLHAWLPRSAFLFVLGGIILSSSRSAWFASCAGTLATIPHLRISRPHFRRTSLWTLLLILVLVILAPSSTIRRLESTFAGLDEGISSRMWMSTAAQMLFRKYSVLGAGPANYAYWSPSLMGDALAEEHTVPPFDIQRQADHPHSDPLRILSETGLVGCGLWGWMFYRLFKTRGIEWAGLTSFGAFALFNGPLQSTAHTWPVLLLASGLLAQRPQKRSTPRRFGFFVPLFFVGMAMLLVLLSIFFIWAVLVPSYRLTLAQDMRLAGGNALTLYEEVVRHPWPNAEAHKEYGIALAEANRNREARCELTEALKGADTGDIYLALALLSTRLRDPVTAYKEALACLRRWPGNREVIELIALLKKESHSK